MTGQEKSSVLQTLEITRGGIAYLRSKFILIFLAGLVGGIAGVAFAWLQKPEYTAEITFAPETDKGGGMGMYAGLAAQFGIDMGSAGGGAFEGDNLSDFLKSRMLIEKALFTPVNIDGRDSLLINYFLEINKSDNKWAEHPTLKNFYFTEKYQPGNRVTDSVVLGIIKHLSKALDIDKKDKKLNIISAKIKDENEVFAKLFIETLVTNGINYYVEYKSGKSRQNVRILQKQADSVKGLLTGNIVSIAAENDLNINPLRQVIRSNVQRKQVDVQVNGQLYGELVKQLELSKIALRRETPFIQVIDTPRLPLEKKKLGRLKGGIIFSFFAVIITLLFLFIQFIWKQYVANLKNYE